MVRATKVFVVCVSLITLLLAQPMQARAEGVIPVFKLKGPLTEQPSAVGLGPLFGEASPLNMFKLLDSLKAARGDENVKAVIFEIDQAALGFGQMQELRAQFETLRAADKDVWVYAESLGNGTLYLGSAASRLVLVPAGEVLFNGLYGEAMYFKGLLDNIGVEADMLHIGDFKSAGEPFYRTGPSEEAEAQQDRLLDSIFDQMIKGIAKSRRLSEERVRELVDVGLFSAEEAKKVKLVDKLMYREDFIKSIRRQYGEETKVDAKYGAKKGPDIDFESPFAIFKLFGDMMKGPEKSTATAIAVVYVESAITTGKSEPGMFGGVSNAGSETIRKAIAEATKDESVKALILRVDSPGGSALASDVICEASARFKESGRPFIVSMGNVAASGGYYVSSLADNIFAEPTTITGSIGVVGGKFITKGLWDWAGVTTHEYKRGELSDMMNTNRPWSEDQRRVIHDMMIRVYGDFKERITDGRGERIKGDLESLAGGRVYTGIQALELGLVDQLGGFTDAVKYAAAEAEVSDYELRVFPRPKTIIDLLAEAFSGKDTDEEFVRLGRAVLGSRFGGLEPVSAAVEAIRAIDPQKAKVVADFLIQMELLADESVLMLGPCSTTIIR